MNALAKQNNAKATLMTCVIVTLVPLFILVVLIASTPPHQGYYSFKRAVVLEIHTMRKLVMFLKWKLGQFWTTKTEGSNEEKTQLVVRQECSATVSDKCQYKKLRFYPKILFNGFKKYRWIAKQPCLNNSIFVRASSFARKLGKTSFIIINISKKGFLSPNYTNFTNKQWLILTNGSHVILTRVFTMQSPAQ